MLQELSTIQDLMKSGMSFEKLKNQTFMEATQQFEKIKTMIEGRLSEL